MANVSTWRSVLHVGGYAAARDGGAACYRRVLSEPNHAGKVQSQDGAWWEIIGDVVTPQMFGAKADGLADDTPSIQAAIDRGGRYIYLPEGIYIHTHIELGEGQTLFGAGMYGKSILKLKDGAADLFSAVGLRGLTAKSGITECTFRDFEYDGNTEKNRDWGSGSTRWSKDEYDLIYTQGIYFGTLGNRVPPLRAFLENIYIHDTVRSSIVWGSTKIFGKNWHLANSDADHLIYESGFTGSDITDVVLEGFSRNGYIVCDEGIQLKNLTFRNLSGNPTAYDGQLLIGTRNSGKNPAALISNVTVHKLDPDVLRGSGTLAIVFQFLGSVILSGFTYIGGNTAHKTSIAIFSWNKHLGSDQHYEIYHVSASNLGSRTQLVQVDSVAAPIRDLLLKSITLSFAEKMAVADQFLVNLQGSIEGLTIDGLSISGRGTNNFALAAPNRIVTDVKFKRVFMESCKGWVLTKGGSGHIAFEQCDFQGPEVKGLTSDGSTDNVFTSNVRIGNAPRMSSGKSIQSGNGVSTTFQIPHGLNIAPKSFKITPIGAAGMAKHKTTANSTNLVITFDAAPPEGNANLVFIWVAKGPI
ncbi:hypothetical protein NKH41_21795 [Mesorhizobium sp. M1169]|uniref:glycosyl hydrolase family 28-related protein n=1 Tax=Mesorhizobium sp. M1169 TaxID=2957066 RepID=UPI00333A29AC